MFNELGTKIFLDRYSLKSHSGYIPPGERVLYRDSTTGQKEIGTVTAVGESGELTLAEAAGSFRRTEVDYPIETVEDTFTRVARKVARAPEELEDYLEILGRHFMPAGRILESTGSGINTTSMNCFVLPSPKDQREGIFYTLQQMAEMMCRGGGVGINYSTLRPENAYVSGVNGRSSGAVSWLELFSYVTNLIIQGGSRRGAQMAMMADWHPDIFKFIDLKRQPGRATGCNMSVVVSDEFMEAVKADKEWALRFPDTQYAQYDNQWEGDIKRWEYLGYPIIVWQVVRARDLWDAIVKSAHACAEPGLWFGDRANAEAPGGGRLVATNPCGEQGLPGWGVCNLGHLILPSFVQGNEWEGGASFDFVKLCEVVEVATMFLDGVIDVANYPHQASKDTQQRERRIGLGTLGLGEALIRLGIRYGSARAEAFCSTLYRRIAFSAYRTSAEMAQKDGPYPYWDWDRFRNSGFGRRLLQRHEELAIPIKQYGLRNCCLLTQAPTGTVGTMLGTSTGIEPYYLLEYQRNSRLGTHIERARVVEGYKATHKDAPLPDYFVTAMDLEPAEHVAMQAAIQMWTDASISKTINCPKSWSVEQVGDVYMKLYESGCKGGTVYRDGCRDVQVLEQIKDTTPAPTPAPPKRRPSTYPSSRPSVTASRETPGGTVHVHLTRDPECGDPLEVFCDAGKSGSEVRALMEAMGRIMTLVLRVRDTDTPSDRLLAIISQLGGIGGMHSVGLGPNRVLSMPDGIASALLEAESWGKCGVQQVQPTRARPAGGVDVCPSCQGITLQRASGCETCDACGYSRC